MSKKLQIVDTPTWLLDPPDGEASAPPVVTRAQILPLSALGWKDFERLCLRLAKLSGEAEHWQLYGTEGQKQGGIDIYVRSPGAASYTVWQAKRYKLVQPADLDKAVKTFLNGPWAAKTSHFVFCTSASMEDVRLADAVELAAATLRSSGITLEIQDAVHISETLKAHPDLVDDFFDRPWVEHFCGKAAAIALSDRLGRADYATLRQRLGALYEAHFEAIDPGVLRAAAGFGTPTRALPLAQRFVPVDFEPAVIDQAVHFEEIVENVPDRVEQESSNYTRRRMQRTARSSQSQRISFADWGQTFDKAIVFGPPGAGKSTVLRFLTLELLQGSPRFPSLKKRWPGHLPLVLSFPFWTKLIQSSAPGMAISVPSAVKAWLEANGASDLAALATRAFEHRKVLLLVDGIDEWANEAAATTALTLLQTFVQTHALSTIVTSRPHGARLLSSLDATWSRFAIAPFDTRQQVKFAESWFTFLAEQQAGMAGDALARAQAFVQELTLLPDVASLAGTPLLLGGLLALSREGASLPRSRFKAYQELTDRLLTQQPNARARAALTGTSLPQLDLQSRELVLAALAFAIQTNRVSEIGLDAIERTDAHRICKAAIMLHLDSPASLANQQARDLLNVSAEAIGILVEKSTTAIGFLHRSFQELLSAKHITGLPLADQQTLMQAHAQDPQWRDILLFVAQLSARSDDVEQLIAAIESVQVDSIDDAPRTLLLADLTFSEVRRTPRLTRRLAERLFQMVECGPDLDLRAGVLKRIVPGLASDQTAILIRPKLRNWFPRFNAYNLAQTLDLISDWGDPGIDDILWQNLGSDEDLARFAAAKGLARRHAGSPEWRHKVESLLARPATIEICASALTLLDLGWGDEAGVSSIIDSASARPGTLMEVAVIRARIRAGRQNADDRDTVLSWFDETLYTLRDEAAELLISGWSGDPYVKSVVLKNLNKDYSYNEPYLHVAARAFPQDEAVALAVADHLRKKILIADARSLFGALAQSFPGHTGLANLVLEPAYRGESRVISTYERSNAARVSATAELRQSLLNDMLDAGQFRFWTVGALLEHWSDDAEVIKSLKAVEHWDPRDLSRIADKLIEIFPADLAKVERLLRNTLQAAIEDSRVHLGDIVLALGRIGVLQADTELVDEVLDIIGRRNPGSISIDDAHIRLFEFCAANSKVRSLAQSSIRTRHGYIGVIGLCFRADPEIRAAVLENAAPLPLELRAVLADSLKDRAIEDPWARALLEEGSGDAETQLAVTCTLRGAQARHAAGTSDAKYVSKLEDELRSLGISFESRRLSGFLALATVGELDRAVEIVKAETALRLSIRPWDFVASSDFGGLLADAWSSIRHRLDAAGLPNALEISDNALVEQFSPFASGRPHLARLVDEATSRAFANNVATPAMLRFRMRDATARPEVLERALPLLVDGESWNEIERSLEVAELVSQEFAGNDAVHDRIAARLAGGYVAGPVAALCDGWPASPALLAFYDSLRSDKTRRGQLQTPVAFKLLATLGSVDSVMAPLNDMIERAQGSVWDGIPYWRTTMRRRVREDEELQTVMIARLKDDPTTGEVVTYASYLSVAVGTGSEVRGLLRALLEIELARPVARAGLDLWHGGVVLAWKRLSEILTLTGGN